MNFFALAFSGSNHPNFVITPEMNLLVTFRVIFKIKEVKVTLSVILIKNHYLLPTQKIMQQLVNFGFANDCN